MPAVESVVGLECDLTKVTDVAAQEAVHEFARRLEHDNEHNRPLDHIVDLLRGWAPLVTAAAAIDGEYGRYVVTLVNGRVARIPLDSADARARYERLRQGGIRIVNPHAEVRGDPLFAGRVRQKLEAVERAEATDIERLLRALATYPIADMIPLRERIYGKLTVFGGAAAEDALVAAVAREDVAVVPVMIRFIRMPEVLRRLAELRPRVANPRITAQLAELLDPEPSKTDAPPSDVDVGTAIDEALLAALRTGDPHARALALSEASIQRDAKHVPTFVAALADPANRGATKKLLKFRSSVYAAIAAHESTVARDAMLAGLRTEHDDIVPSINYVAWRQEQLMAQLPAIVLAAWRESPRDERYVGRLLLLWHEHAESVPPVAWHDVDDELMKRTATLRKHR